jgi:hypothetical protein
VNSPERRDDAGDDRFERRIDDAARALRGRAPDVLARARDDARDLAASVDAATRALTPTAPADAWTAIRARLADPDAALDAAARAATPAAPPVPFHELLARARAPDPRAHAPAPQRRRALRRRLLLLRGGPLAAAAAIVVMALLLTRSRGTPPVNGGPSLLTAGQLATATKEEDRLALEADRLAKSIANGAAGAAGINDEGQALLEEKDFLDDAIVECRTALAANARHPQLREQLEELSRQRVELLHRIVAIGTNAPPPADGEGR